MNPKVRGNKRLSLYLLVFISLSANAYFRMNNLFLPSVENKARIEVLGEIKKELSSSVSELSSGLGNEDREKFLGALLQEKIRQEKRQINARVIARAKEIKEYFLDERGRVYLQEIDPYRWFRRINNFLNTGIFGTRRINGMEYDDLMFAPVGFRVEPIKLHFYIGATFYKILHLFNKRLALTDALSLHPVVFSSFLVIVIFLISSLLGISPLGAYLASIFIGLSPVVLFRSSFGWFDTDIYNMFMPLAVTSVLAYSFKVRRDKSLIFLLLAGLLMGIYSAIWAAWWLLFYVLLSGLAVYKLEIILWDEQHKLMDKIKDSFISLFMFIFFAYAAVWLISGPEVLKGSFTEPFHHIATRAGLAAGSFWPSMAPYILELQPSDSKFFFFGVGGPLIVYGGLMGFLIFIYRQRTKGYGEKRFLFHAMFAWLLVTLLLTWSSRRFSIFLTVPLVIFLGMSIDAVRDFLASLYDRIRALKKIRKRIYNLSLAGVFFLVSAIPLYKASGLSTPPFMNDSWMSLMTKIKSETPSDSIINSWWDCGDFVMSIANRATLHDAAWQHTPVSYWFAKALMSKEEDESLGILRMLNSGSSRGFDELCGALGNDKFFTAQLVKELVLLSESEGRHLLSSHIGDNGKVEKISRLIYGPPKTAYVLLYNHLVDFVEGLSSIGNWDFRRLDLWQAFTRMNRQDFLRYAEEKHGFPPDKAETVYRTLRLTDKKNISSWISKEGYRFLAPYVELPLPPEGEKLLLFDNGLAVDRENLRAFFSLGAGWIIPGKVIFINEGEIRESINEEGNKDFAVLLSRKNDIYKATLFTAPLAETLFFKLYFLNGKGLKHFKLFHKESKKGFTHIYLYKINWEEAS